MIGVYEKGFYTVRDTSGKHTKVYRTWSNMLRRCEPGGIEQKLHPTYVGCEVHPDFIKFQDFAAWCHKQVGFGNHGWDLDKDILVPGNKVYGPDTCCFVPQELNKLLLVKTVTGIYPVGVYLEKKSGRYKSQISIDGRRHTLGRFDTSESAYAVYQTAKIAEIHRQAEKYRSVIDHRVYIALKNYNLIEN